VRRQNFWVHGDYGGPILLVGDSAGAYGRDVGMQHSAVMVGVGVWARRGYTCV
jgi:peroxiredoxin